MPNYLSPGVYVEEVEAGSRPIEGVGTAVLAELGARDAVAAPALIGGAREYRMRRAAEGGGGRRRDLLPNPARHGFRHRAAQRRRRSERDALSIVEHHGLQADDLFGAAGARAGNRWQRMH